MSNNLPTAFLVVFDNKLPRSKRVDILQDAREQPWWQETDYGQSGRMNVVRIIVAEASQFEEAKAYFNAIEGVTAENMSYMDTQNNASYEGPPMQVSLGIGWEMGAMTGPSPMIMPGFSSLEFHYERLDPILTAQLRVLKDKNPDIHETKLDIYLTTVAGIDEATATQLEKLGVEARASETKATFIGEVSLKALSLLSEYEEVVEKLFGSVQYQAL